MRCLNKPWTTIFQIARTNVSIRGRRTEQAARQIRGYADSPDVVGAPFYVRREEAQTTFRLYHRRFFLETPQVESIEQRYVPYYIFDIKAEATATASVMRSMSVPVRDPQTGKIQQRHQTIYTKLPGSKELELEFVDGEPITHVYAGLEMVEDMLDRLPCMELEHIHPRPQSRVPEEAFGLAINYAKAKLRQRFKVIFETAIIDSLSKTTPGTIRIDTFNMNIDFKSVMKAYYPLWIFNTNRKLYNGSSMRTIVSGYAAGAAGYRIGDKMVLGIANGAILGGISLYVASGLMLSTAMVGLGYIATKFVISVLQGWRERKHEALRRLNYAENEQYKQQGETGEEETSESSSRFTSEDPFEAFTSSARARARSADDDPFDKYNPFAGAGSFNGQTRSSDPFYGYKRTKWSSSSRTNTSGSSSRSSRTAPPPRPERSQAPRTLYTILGVDRTATQDQIHTAYRNAALAKHPDKASAENKAAATEEFAKINEAFAILRSPEKRKEYDRTGKA